MSHDFLTSMRSDVFPTEAKKRSDNDSEVVESAKRYKSRRGRKAMADGVKNHTVGVSMSPGLQARAVERAGEIGVSFSRYVQWCIEAELDGVPLRERF